MRIHLQQRCIQLHSWSSWTDRCTFITGVHVLLCFIAVWNLYLFDVWWENLQPLWSFFPQLHNLFWKLMFLCLRSSFSAVQIQRKKQGAVCCCRIWAEQTLYEYECLALLTFEKCWTLLSHSPYEFTSLWQIVFTAFYPKLTHSWLTEKKHLQKSPPAASRNLFLFFTVTVLWF